MESEELRAKSVICRFGAGRANNTAALRPRFGMTILVEMNGIAWATNAAGRAGPETFSGNGALHP